jgi:hypothetical protein
LNPGLYTLEVSPESSPGVGIVEVYEYPVTEECQVPDSNCPCPTPSNCPDLNKLPIMDDVKPSMSIGIDGDRNAIKSFSCLQGTTKFIDGGTATFDIDAITSYSDLLRASKKTAAGKISIGFFNAGGNVSEGKSFRQTSYEQSFAMKYVVSLGTQKFFPNATKPFTPLADQYKTNSCSMRQYCGDRFVEQAEVGAQLYITMNFKFSSEEYKKGFMASANAGISTTLKGTICTACGAVPWSIPVTADISASINKLSQTVKQNGTMEVTAFQEGGSVENLAGAIGSSFSTCSLTDISACKALMDKAINYAATKFADSVRTTQPKILSYSSNLLSTIPGVPIMSSDLTPEIEKARDEIATEYEKRIADKERAELLLASYVLGKIHVEQLTSLIQGLEKDIESLRSVGKLCFSDLSNCLPKKCEVFKNLTAYTENVFKLSINEGMVGYYPLDGNTLDKSFSKNDGVARNPVSYVAGKFGQAAKFTDGYIEVPNIKDFTFGNQSFAFSVWTTIAHNYKYVYIPFISLGWADGDLIHLGKNRGGNDSSGTIFMDIHQKAGVNSLETGSELLTKYQSNWLHVVGVVDYENRVVKLYLNGQLQGTKELKSSFQISSQAKLLIGYSVCCTSGDRYYGYQGGLMDEVRIYNRSLSDADVKVLYQMK